MPRLRRFCLPTRTERGSITPLTMWWVATTCAGLFAVAHTVESLNDAQCAHTFADAVALAHVAHGSTVAGEFARTLGVRAQILRDSPLVVKVESGCGAAVSAADVQSP